MSDSLAALYGHISALFDCVGKREGLSEIMVNADSSVWIERLGIVSKTDYKLDAEKGYSIIKMLAGFNNQVCDYLNPTLAVRLPDELSQRLNIPSGRVQAIIPPITLGPTICIRVPSRVKPSLEDLGKGGLFNYYIQEHYKKTKELLNVNTVISNLKSFISTHQNIMTTGGTGSGKTTLGNALLDCIKNERVFVIEDIAELNLENDDTSYMLTNENYTARMAVFTTQRMRPDRIVIGELRDGQTAVELCNAFVNGHRGGLVTFHADSSIHALRRLRSLMLQAANRVEPETIYDAIDVVIHISKKYFDNNPTSSFTRVIDDIFIVNQNRDKIFSKEVF
jgi:type IV secretion system protein VirB11